MPAAGAGVGEAGRPTAVSVVVPAYGADPWLERCVRSALASTEVDVEVVVVDNGGTEGVPDRLAALDRVRVVRPATNLGYAGGCNAGLGAARGQVVVFLNQDATVEPPAVARLAEVALEPGVGAATASIRLAGDVDRLNSCGNPLHFLGFSWSGGFGDPARVHPRRQEVTGASGAALAVRRSLLDELGGFAEEYFAYHEDIELSLRCWLRGLAVVYVPEAVVVHRYEMSRNPTKYYLLERNRLLLVTTVYQRRTLALLLPALVTTELAMLAVAAAGGWGRQKVAGWRWLWRNRRRVRARRRLLQAERLHPDRDLVPRLAAHFEAGNLPLMRWARPLDAVLARYWWLVRRGV